MGQLTLVGHRREGAVAVVELARPQAGNALTAAMRAELASVLAYIGADAGSGEVRAVLLAAQGRHFCVGQDLKEHAAALDADPATAFDIVAAEYNPLVRVLRALPVPVVGAVEGACVGAGLGLALGADLRVAATGARFGTAFTAIGLAADTGLSGALVELVGRSRAAELLLLAEQFGAEDALRWGLVHRVVPDGEATAAGLELAGRLAAGPTAAYAEVKSLLAQAGSPGELDREAAAQARLGLTRDHAGAVRAFLAREKPSFTGR